jgi:cytochrome c-type biogenesis protein
MVLLASYSLGLGVPFLIAAFAVETFLDWFQRFKKHIRWVQRVSGLLLILVGILLMTGQFTRMAAWLQGLTPGFLRSRL